MNRFVAIDLGARRVQVVIQDADGVVLVNSNLEARLDDDKISPVRSRSDHLVLPDAF